MEEWRDIPNYEGLYQVSNYGRVKSLERTTNHSSGGKMLIKERILKPSVYTGGYLITGLNKKGKRKSFSIHQLVAITFLGHDRVSKMVVDHIDRDRRNNKVSNLQVISQRQNTSRTKRGISKYTGVSWHKRDQKWSSQIYINGKIKYLGYFKTELETHEAYQEECNSIRNVIFKF